MLKRRSVSGPIDDYVLGNCEKKPGSQEGRNPGEADKKYSRYIMQVNMVLSIYEKIWEETGKRNIWKMTVVFRKTHKTYQIKDERIAVKSKHHSCKGQWKISKN